MDRRDFLLAVVAAAVGGLAGCGGSGRSDRTPPAERAPDGGGDREEDGGVNIVDFGTSGAEDGRLIVWVVVRNETGARREATVTADVRAGEESFTRRAAVTVDPGASVRHELAFDIAADRFNRSGSLSLSVE